MASSRPNAPGLIAEPSTLGGKQVTTMVYPGGTVLYLYPQGERVFYIGTQNKTLAEKAIGLLPCSPSSSLDALPDRVERPAEGE